MEIKWHKKTCKTKINIEKITRNDKEKNIKVRSMYMTSRLLIILKI